MLDLLREFEGARDEETRALVSTSILLLLRQLPGGVETLRRVHQGDLRCTRKGELYFPEVLEGEALMLTGDLPSEAALNAQLAALLHPPTVTRYTDIYAPARVVVGERFPIIVGLTRGPTDGEEVQPSRPN
jgi:hypothetical protein